MDNVLNTSNIKSSGTEKSNKLGVISAENKKVTSGIGIKLAISSQVLEEATKEGNLKIGKPDDDEMFTYKFTKSEGTRMVPMNFFLKRDKPKVVPPKFNKRKKATFNEENKKWKQKLKNTGRTPMGVFFGLFRIMNLQTFR